MLADFGHRTHDVARARSLQPFERFDDRVGHALRCAGIALQEFDRRVQCAAGHRATEQLLRAAQQARVHGHADVAARLQQADQRVAIRDGRHLAIAQRHHGGQGTGQCHVFHIVRPQPAARHHLLGKPVRGRVPRRDADLAAAQLRQLTKAGQRPRTHPKHQLRRAGEQRERLAFQAPLAQHHRVFQPARRQVARALRQRLLYRARAVVFVKLNVQPFRREVLQLRSHHERQLVQRAAIAQGDVHAGAFGLAGARSALRPDVAGRPGQGGKTPKEGTARETRNRHWQTTRQGC